MELLLKFKSFLTNIFVQLSIVVAAILSFVIYFHPSNEENSKLEFVIIMLNEYIYEAFLVFIFFIIAFIFQSLNINRSITNIKFSFIKKINKIYIFLSVVTAIALLYNCFQLSRHAYRHIKNYSNAYRSYLFREYAESMRNKNFIVASTALTKIVANYPDMKEEFLATKSTLDTRIKQSKYFISHAIDTNLANGKLSNKALTNLMTAYAYYPDVKIRQLLIHQDSLIKLNIDQANKFYQSYQKRDSVACCKLYVDNKEFLFESEVNRFICKENNEPRFSNICWVLHKYSLDDYIGFLNNYWMLNGIDTLVNKWDIKIEYSRKEK